VLWPTHPVGLEAGAEVDVVSAEPESVGVNVLDGQLHSSPAGGVGPAPDRSRQTAGGGTRTIGTMG